MELPCPFGKVSKMQKDGKIKSCFDLPNILVCFDLLSTDKWSCAARIQQHSEGKFTI